eukprot:11160807-Lingulodinium_polyedra.AAC.1
MTGTPTWVCLPVGQRSGKAKHVGRPVCRFWKALYGHPDSGAFWDNKCDSHARSVGFEPIGPEWPSRYMHSSFDLRM